MGAANMKYGAPQRESFMSQACQTGAVKRVRLADDVARIAWMPPGTAIKLVQPDAVQVLDELGQTCGGLPHDTILVELLSECIFD